MQKNSVYVHVFDGAMSSLFYYAVIFLTGHKNCFFWLQRSINILTDGDMHAKQAKQQRFELTHEQSG